MNSSEEAKIHKYGFTYRNRSFPIGVRVGVDHGERMGELIGGSSTWAIFRRDDGRVTIVKWAYLYHAAECIEVGPEKEDFLRADEELTDLARALNEAENLMCGHDPVIQEAANLVRATSTNLERLCNKHWPGAVSP